MKYKPLDLTGLTTVGQAAAILASCNLYIGNDSALLFVAASVGIPTIGIYGPTDSKLIEPYGDNHVSVQSPTECSPCYNPINGVQGKAYRCNSQKCMLDVKVETVFDIAKEILVWSYESSPSK